MNETRPVIETTRLVLRGFEPGDAADVQRLAGDPAIADTTLSIPHPYLDGVAEQWIATHADNWREGKALNLAITLKDGGELVGAIGLMDIQSGHRAEMGYWIAKAHWSKGLCTEAAAALVDYAFETMGLRRVYAHHMSRNPASGAVMRKIGMSHEGRLLQHVVKNDIAEDIEIYGLLNPKINR